MKIIFMGTPDFAVPTLQALISASEHEVVAVYSQPPRPAGRGHKLTPSPVQQLAEAHNIPVYTPASLKSEEQQRRFRAHGADIAVVAAYGLILPQAILEGCSKGCINVHPSDLPRWRGAAPIQRTIMAGDTNTAMCIMQMDEGLDTGAVLWRENISLPDDSTAGKLHDVMANKGAEAVLDTLLRYDSLRPQPQQGEPTYASKVTKKDALIDWSRPAESIYNQIRGLNPYPAARAMIGGEEVKIFAAVIPDLDESIAAKAMETSVDRKSSFANAPLLDSRFPPSLKLRRTGRGNDGIIFVCGDGQHLHITELQRPGKKRMSAADALRGWDISSIA